MYSDVFASARWHVAVRVPRARRTALSRLQIEVIGDENSQYRGDVVDRREVERRLVIRRCVPYVRERIADQVDYWHSCNAPCKHTDPQICNCKLQLTYKRYIIFLHFRYNKCSLFRVRCSKHIYAEERIK